MPTIAAHSAQFAPAFYWHLGDLRAIYKIDEDMAFEAANHGQVLACDVYQRRAWNDFVENQIAAFGSVPFYVGIGNHEVIPPKTEDAFKRQFTDWLDQPALQRQRSTGQRTGAARALLSLDSEAASTSSTSTMPRMFFLTINSPGWHAAWRAPKAIPR